MQKISQFSTIKPKQNTYRTDDKSIQTINSTTTVDMIQEKAHELCKQNRKLSYMLA
jgi:hypothetical protein